MSFEFGIFFRNINHSAVWSHSTNNVITSPHRNLIWRGERTTKFVKLTSSVVNRKYGISRSHLVDVKNINLIVCSTLCRKVWFSIYILISWNFEQLIYLNQYRLTKHTILLKHLDNTWLNWSYQTDPYLFSSLDWLFRRFILLRSWSVDVHSIIRKC